MSTDDPTSQTTTKESTRFEPPPSEMGAPFWQATRERRLDLPWCTACNRAIWYPRPTCPDCLGTDIEWRTAPPLGVAFAGANFARPFTRVKERA